MSLALTHDVPILVVIHISISDGNRFWIPRKINNCELQMTSLEVSRLGVTECTHKSMLPLRLRGISVPAAVDEDIKLGRDNELCWFSSTRTSSETQDQKSTTFKLHFFQPILNSIFLVKSHLPILIIFNRHHVQRVRFLLFQCKILCS